MGGRFPRVQSVLLLLIVLLLFLNIILPARYTLQLVRVEPVPLETEREGGLGTSAPPLVATQLEIADDVSASEKTAPPTAKNASRGNGGRRYVRDVLPELSEKKDVAEEVDFLWGREEGVKKRDFREKKEEKREEWEEGEREKINFHDPAQRIAYYKRLRRKLVGGGPNMRSLQQQRAKRRLELVRDMWDGWFEDDNDDKPLELEGLERYVTEEISPGAIQTQLSQCTTALGVSPEQLETQRGDLRKTSAKLSAFLSAVKSLVPNTFPSKFTSPCWYTDRINTKSNILGITTRIVGLEGHLQILPNQATYLAKQAFGESFTEHLVCLPQFFLAGFPKSATTTLSEVLFAHPQISSALVKETHWWTRAPMISPSGDLLRLTVLRYLMHFRHMAHFAEERPGLLSMDGSQSTLWDSNFVFNGHDFCSTPAAISHTIPGAKFMVVMREPSERLYSYYLWSCSFKYGNNTKDWPRSVREDPAGNFHSEVSQSVAEFNQCTQTHSLYECANRFTFNNGTKVTQYCGQIGFRLVVSIYYIHILKFLQFFPREQFLFLRMEDMVREPVAFLHRATDFLGVHPYPVREVRDVLERKRNKQRAGIEPMHGDTKELLHEFFAPYNRQLAELLNDNRFLWDYS